MPHNLSSNIGGLTFAFGALYQRMAFQQAQSFHEHGLPFAVILEKGFSDAYVAWDSLDNTQVIELAKEVDKPFEFERYAYDLTPFEVTIKTDADLVLPAGWTGLPLWYTCQDLISGIPTSIQGLEIPSSPYRRAWSVYGVPEVHSAFFLFRKSAQAKSFFERVGVRFDTFYSTSAKEVSRDPSTDLIYSLAWLDVVGPELGPCLPFLHMKFGTSGLTAYRDNWVSNANLMRDSNGMYLNGVQLVNPVHYYDKSFSLERI
jgi:hypothetical protein